MELYRKVRHACFRQGMSKRAIAREFGIARDSMDKMIVYSVPLGDRCTAPVKRPKLDGSVANRGVAEDLGAERSDEAGW